MRNFREDLKDDPCWGPGTEKLFRETGVPSQDIMLQNREELIVFCEFLETNKVRSYLEIGNWTGKLVTVLHRLFSFDKVAAADIGWTTQIGLPFSIPKEAEFFLGSSHSSEFREWRKRLQPSLRPNGSQMVLLRELLVKTTCNLLLALFLVTLCLGCKQPKPRVLDIGSLSVSDVLVNGISLEADTKTVKESLGPPIRVVKSADGIAESWDFDNLSVGTENGDIVSLSSSKLTLKNQKVPENIDVDDFCQSYGAPDHVLADKNAGYPRLNQIWSTVD